MIDGLELSPNMLSWIIYNGYNGIISASFLERWSMITFAKLGQYGRKGNCLFQMAATIALAHRNNDEYKFPLWEFSKEFNIDQDKFGEISYKETFNEPHFNYCGIPYKRNLNLMGYFQSYKYFQDESDLISKLLRPRQISQHINATSIHVRRTDYLTHKGCYNILDMSYYEKAMEMSNDNRFLVFSDDINWCKKHFIGNQFDFSENNSDIKDLSKIIACSNNIIANSSFSWWGAWLNKNKNKKVIAPNKWFGPKLTPTHDVKDLCPEGWLKI